MWRGSRNPAKSFCRSFFNRDANMLLYTANEGPMRMQFKCWFLFMYSQELNCAASLFPKQNCNVLSPNFHIRVSNRSQTHECRNWERGRAVSFLGIHIFDFRYSVWYLYSQLITPCPHHRKDMEAGQGGVIF